MVERIRNLLEMIFSLSEAESGVLLFGGEVKYNYNFRLSAGQISKIKDSASDKENYSVVSSIDLPPDIKSGVIFRLPLGNKKENYYLILLFDKERSFNDKKLEKTASLIKNNLKALEYENHLENPFSKIKTPVLFSDYSGELITANDDFYSLFGIDSCRIDDFNWGNYKLFDIAGNVINKDDLPVYKIFDSEKNIVDFQLEVAFDNDKKIWLKINSYKMNKDSSEGELAINLFENITELKKAELRLKETAENIDSILYSTDASGREYYLVSGAVEKVVGFTREEIIRKKLLLIRSILPDYLPVFKEFVLDLKNGTEAMVEYKLKDKFGKIKFIRHTGVPIVENGKIVRIVGLITDISKEREILEKLKKSEQQFRLLIQTAEDFIFILDNYGYFTMVNKNGALALSFRPEEMIGRHFLEFVEEESKAEIAVSFQKILTTTDIVPFEAQLSDKFGKTKVFDIQARQIIDSGEVKGLLGIGRDITDRKKDENKLKDLNAKLVEANRLVSIERDRAKNQVSSLEELNKLKNEFISNISHELRTPLASIVGFAESLVSDPDLPPDMVAEFNTIILTEGKRLARLINNVLDFSKLESNKGNLNKTKFDFITLLKEVIDSHRQEAEGKKIILSSEIPEAEIIVFADRERMAKVIGNILNNAIKFTESDGRVTIIINDFLKEVELIISDTGIGIPKEDIPYLFEKFRKVNRPGSQLPGAGFGLVTVKQIIDLHRGLIRIQSEVGKGTTVIIKLPK